MNYWVTADTHLGHMAMIEKCGRPDDFSRRIVNNTAAIVQEGDVLIHLGDFCLYADEFWNEQFSSKVLGKHWLVRGNHDRKTSSWYLSRGWDCVVERLDMSLFGVDIAFTHRPVWPHMLEAGQLNIHGHHHNTRHHPEDEVTFQHRCINVEDNNYGPINLRRVIETWGKKC
jgi:calcineurin-like phosphoesterase family protein